MNFTYPILAAVAGIVAQGAVAQARSTPSEVPSGVSMQVINTEGDTAGFACEPFVRVPHDFTVLRGTPLAVEMFGRGKSPYILFAGAPSASCYVIPWVLGGVTMEPPFLIVEVGFVPPTAYPTACGLDVASTVVPIPDKVPSGVQLVLQTAAWPLDLGMPAFSRGVTLSAK